MCRAMTARAGLCERMLARMVLLLLIALRLAALDAQASRAAPERVDTSVPAGGHSVTKSPNA